MAEIEDIQKLEVIDTTEINQELLRFRKGYYRDKFRLLAMVTLLITFINLVLTIVMFYIYLVKPKVPQEFYTSNLYNGEDTRIYSLDQPMLKPNDLTNWAQKTITDSLNFNFVNYQDIFSEIKNSYTDNGWTTFHDSLYQSGIMDQLITNKLFLSATPTANAVIFDDGVISGYHAWRIQIPLVLDFKASENDATSQKQQKVTVNVIIMRIPDVENPENIAIDRFDLSWER